LLNAKPFLNFAAKKAGSTRAMGLEEMTISMLKGEQGNQADELEHMVEWIKKELEPDVIYLANVLLIGLAHRIKKSIRVPIVCGLEDEDIWLEDMDEHSRNRIWQIISERAVDVDTFVPVSDYYRQQMIEKIQIPAERFQTIHIGIDTSGFEAKTEFTSPHIIGYLSRLMEPLGLGILVEAFILLKKKYRHHELMLHVTGGMTGDDIDFLGKMKNRLKEADCLDDVVIVENYDRKNRIKFLKELTLLSVPMIHGEAFGLFQLEAMASGVPIVQPRVGAFPEVIEMTGGGVVYNPNNPDQLAETISTLLSDPQKLSALSRAGRTSVLNQFNNTKMANRLIEVYEMVVSSQ